MLAFGCGSRFMAYKDDDEAVGVLSKAIDLGFTYIDTANNYGNGRSEQLVGRLMPARRSEVFLQTKLAARKGDEARKQLEDSLKRLKTDRLDLLHIHSLTSLDDLAAIEAKGGVLEVVRKAKEEKLTRFIGITGHASPQAMQQALERHDFDCVQMALNAARARMEFDDKGPNPVPMADASYETLALPVAVKKKMGIIAMKVFGQDQAAGRRRFPGEAPLLRALAAGEPRHDRHAQARAPRAQHRPGPVLRPARRRGDAVPARLDRGFEARAARAVLQRPPGRLAERGFPQEDA